MSNSSEILRPSPGRPRSDVSRLVLSATPICVLIEMLKMNDDQFAAFAGVSKSTVRQYRFGDREPKLRNLYDLTVRAQSLLGYRPSVDTLIEAALRREEAGGRRKTERKKFPA